MYGMIALISLEGPSLGEKAHQPAHVLFVRYHPFTCVDDFGVSDFLGGDGVIESNIHLPDDAFYCHDLFFVVNRDRPPALDFKIATGKLLCN